MKSSGLKLKQGASFLAMSRAVDQEYRRPPTPRVFPAPSEDH